MNSLILKFLTLTFLLIPLSTQAFYICERDPIQQFDFAYENCQERQRLLEQNLIMQQEMKMDRLQRNTAYFVTNKLGDVAGSVTGFAASIAIGKSEGESDKWRYTNDPGEYWQITWKYDRSFNLMPHVEDPGWKMQQTINQTDFEESRIDVKVYFWHF